MTALEIFFGINGVITAILAAYVCKEVLARKRLEKRIDAALSERARVWQVDMLNRDTKVLRQTTELLLQHCGVEVIDVRAGQKLVKKEQV